MIPKRENERSNRLTFWIGVEPMGAVRMTQRGKWVSKQAQRYLDYKEQIAWEIKQRMWLLEREPTKAACAVNIRFVMPIPQSWSKKKQREAEGKYHVSKPDIDNLVKGVFDSASGLIWEDDRQVFLTEAVKVYGKEPGIWLEVHEVF